MTNVDILKTDIYTIESSKKPDGSGGYIYTNDKGLPESYAYALEALSIASNTSGWMLIVGTGGVFSMLPEIENAGINNILFIDNDSRIPKWISHQAQTIPSSLWENYKPPDNASDIFGNGDINKYNIHNAGCFPNNIEHVSEVYSYDPEMERFGKKHLLDSEERFLEIKASLGNMRLYPVHGDLEDEVFMKNIGDLLRRHNVVVDLANLTNVYDHVDRLDQTIAHLPFDDQSVFMWSMGTGIPLCQEPQIGLSNHLDDVRAKAYRYQTSD